PGAHQGPAHLALAGERVGGAVAGALLDLALAVRHVAGEVEVDAEHGSDLRGVYPPGQASARPVGPAGPASRAPAASGAWRRKSASAPRPRRTASHRVASRMRMVAAAAVAWSTPRADSTRRSVMPASVTRRPPGKNDSAPATVVTA